MTLSKQVLEAAAQDASFAKLFGAEELDSTVVCQICAKIVDVSTTSWVNQLGNVCLAHQKATLPASATLSPVAGRQPWEMGPALPTSTFGRFMLAGNATFTVVSKKTGTRFTFKVTKPEPTPQYPNPIHFVKVLTGNQNETDYTYLGQITSRGGMTTYQHGRKSPIGAAAPSALAFAWFAGQVLQGKDAPGVEVYHAGKCGRCGRKLTVPESITSGFGPECLSLVGG